MQNISGANPHRQSNVELLRIICMLMVVMLHFNNHGLDTGLFLYSTRLDQTFTVGHFIEPFCIMAVNCFVLISGYFGITFKCKNLFRLYLDCFCIGLLGQVLCVFLVPGFHLDASLLGRVFAFSHNHWWFILTYLGLFFLSPLLNFAVDSMSKKQHSAIILLFSAFCFYIYCWNFYNDGYLPLFIDLYLIGRYVRKYLDLQKIRQQKWEWLTGYLLCSLGTMLVVCLILKFTGFPILKRLFPYSYYSILVNASALFLLLFFLSLDFDSRIVNWFARSALCAYLLQESVYFGHKFLYPWTESLFPSIASVGEKLLVFFALSIAFFLVAACAGNFFKFLCRPLYRVFDEKIEPWCSKFYVW